MPESLTTHLAGNNFHPALFADDTTVLHAFIFTAITLVVLGRPENLGAKQTITLGLEGPVVNRLGLFNFTERSFTDLFG